MKESGQFRALSKELLENPRAIGLLAVVALPFLTVIYGLIVSNEGAIVAGAGLGIAEAGALRGVTKHFRRERIQGLSNETAVGFIRKILGPPFYHPQGYR